MTKSHAGRHVRQRMKVIRAQANVGNHGKVQRTGKHPNFPAPHYYILDNDHKPVEAADVLEWGAWFENTNNRRVAETFLAGYRISTVFLGIPLGVSWPEDTSPDLFETMVFKDDGEHNDLWMERCATWEEAEHMHRRALAWVGCCAPYQVKDEKETDNENTQDKV